MESRQSAVEFDVDKKPGRDVVDFCHSSNHAFVTCGDDVPVYDFLTSDYSLGPCPGSPDFSFDDFGTVQGQQHHSYLANEVSVDCKIYLLPEQFFKFFKNNCNFIQTEHSLEERWQSRTAQFA